MSQNENFVGVIAVTQESIVVRVDSGCGTTEVAFQDATIESLQEAARLLAAWMELKFENLSDECQRVHRRDQLSAAVRDIVEARKRE